MSYQQVDAIFKASPLSQLLPIQRQFVGVPISLYQAIGTAIFEAYVAGSTATAKIVRDTAMEALDR